MANAPLADAITYGFGDLGLILFLTGSVRSCCARISDAEAKALEAQLGGRRRRR